MALARARVAFAAGPVPLPDIAALTNTDGAFALSAPADGNYVVQCYADGYQRFQATIPVAGGETKRLEVRLEPS
ncbi:MAG: carboxypeptidase-like regulatory domain-containing protein [Acidobacteriota bacterium]|nr:carboxypeptidase-like regulatory domain-containing protein [Acidobacteriota bacterium]